MASSTSSSSNDNDKVPLPGSERTPLSGAKLVGPAAPDEEIAVTVVLKSPQAVPPTPGVAAPQTTASLEDLAVRARSTSRAASLAAAQAMFGSKSQDVARVEAFARKNGLAVGKVEASANSVELKGSVERMNAAFGVTLETYAQEHTGLVYRGRTGPLYIPRSLADIVEAVLGLDDRPQTTPKFQLYSQVIHPRAGTTPVSYTPPQLAQLYQFPTGVDGKGQCIAILELGGGYSTADLETYFATLKLPQPLVKTVRVDGAGNQPTGSANGPDGEVMLDIEVAGAIATGANLVVYFAPNTTKGFLDAINTAIHDTTNNPNVISISWGGPESAWTTQALNSYNQAFQVAASVGITVCCAAGDSGSSDGVGDGKNHVDFPASSPYALACGGTKLLTSAGAGGGAAPAIASETVWNESPTSSATGGGVSNAFAKPDWQAKVKVAKPTGSKLPTGRGLPDVAGDADPATGYAVRVDGEDTVIGGTSAVAPLWAGLIALLNQSLGKPVGYLNPLLYNTLAAKGVLNDITKGNNGAFKAGAGWDACTGWGSPKGVELLDALKK